MSIVYVTISSEKANYLIDTLRPMQVFAQTTGATPDEVAVELDDQAQEHLRSLPEDADGHLDPEGNLWIGGTGYQTEPIHNA